MSFFNDFLDYFKIDDIAGETKIMVILGKGLVVTGKLKILELSEEKIELRCQKNDLIICGKELVVKSIAKGEVVISGIVNSLERKAL